MSMQSDDIREEIFKAINVLVKESLSKMDYLFLVEGVVENKDDFNRVYSFSYNGESHTAVSLTGEDFIKGDSVYVLFSNDRDIKKMIVGKRNRYASWTPTDQIPQIEGPAGKTSYAHIAYADSATGDGMSSSPVGKSYMGMYVDLIKEDSLDPLKYGWVLIKGSDGAPGKDGSQGPQGVEGPAGKDGKATYTWIRYADTSTGGGISNSPTGKEYIGLAHNKETSTESDTPTDYTWSLIRGPQGESGNRGVEGPKGKDGETTYTWIKYSANANGSGLTDTPQEDTAYIGIATNKTAQDESSTPGDYIWSLFKGPKGEAGEVGPRGLQGQQGPEGKQGIQGSKGADGLSSYTHIAYATGAQGQSFNHDTFPEATYIGMYVSPDQDSSGDWNDYEWTLVKGKDGSQGLRGPEGKNGLTPYFHTAWANSADGVAGFDTTVSANKLYIGTATTFESDDPTEPSAYNWTKIKGDKGDQGPKGATGAIGPRGDTGTSVEDIVEYYGLSTSDTVKPTSWVEVVSEATPLPKMTSVNKYLWNYEKINFSDSTSQNTIPVVVGAYGDTGQTGETGSTGSAGVDGRSIVSIKDKYLVTSVSSGVTRSTSGWVDTPTATDDVNKYLWNYEIITWNKAPITTYVDPIIIGVHGLKGATGEKGATGAQGPQGSTGTSVESITEYYLASPASSGILSTNTGFTTAMQLMTPTNKYLWNYEKINFSDGTDQPTIPVVIGIYGDRGQTGGIGPTGRSIVSITEHYLATSANTGVTRSTSGWNTAMQPTTETDRYLWNYETVTWSAAPLTTYVDPIIIGVHGAKGDKGATGEKGATGSIGPQGATGTGVESIVEYYGLSTSASTKPTSWTEIVSASTPFPVMTATNKYLWNYEKIKFSNSSTQDTLPVVVGVYGDKGGTGSPGVDGRSITSIQEKYQVNNLASGVTRATGTWINTPTATSDSNKYLWNYEIVNWNKGTTPTYVDPIIIGVHGLKGDKGETGPIGIAGPKGDNGLPTYTWIAYATSATGTGISLSPTGKDYVGYASGQTSKTPSITTPSLYTWQLVKGATGGQGPQGIQGGTGPKGDPVYTWIKYADTPTSGMTDDPTDKKYIGMAHNKPTATESTAYNQYQWSLMPQNITVGGRNLFPRSGNFTDTGDWSSYTGINSVVVEDGKLIVQTGSTGLPRVKNSALFPLSTIREQYTVSVEYISTTPIILVGKSSSSETEANENGAQSIGDVEQVKDTDLGGDRKRSIFSWLSLARTDTLKSSWLMLLLPVNATVEIINVKVEKGNVATDWTPAPEDIQAEINDNKNKIEGVEKATKENTAQISLNSQGIQQEITERTLMGARLTEETNLLVDATSTQWGLEFTRIENDIKNTDATVKEIKTYYRYNETEAIVGKEGDPMQFYFSNDETGFRENGERISYWKGRTFYVRDLHVLASIIIGQHIIESEGNHTKVRSVK